jgi:hypothetical protein
MDTGARPARWSPRRLATVGGALALAVVTAGLEVHRSWGWGSFDVLRPILSAVAGALVGEMAWLLADPRRRLSRLAIVLAALSWAAWLAFLCFAEPFVPLRLEVGELVHDAPIAVANRTVGTYGSVNAADRLLGLAAGPAVFYMKDTVLLAWPSVDDVAASYVVAGLACVLSSAWWLAFGNAVTAFRHRRRERRAARAALAARG